MLWQPGILQTYFLMFLSTIPYHDWYDLYILVPYSLALTLKTYIHGHLLCGNLLDVVVTWNGYIYDLAPISHLLLYDYVWFVAGDMSVSDDWRVPQDIIIIGFLSLIFRFLLFTMFCKCNPKTLDSHGVGCLVLLLNLALLTVPF